MLMAEIRRSPVEVGSLLPLFSRFYTYQVAVWDVSSINRTNPTVAERYAVAQALRRVPRERKKLTGEDPTAPVIRRNFGGSTPKRIPSRKLTART